MSKKAGTKAAPKKAFAKAEPKKAVAKAEPKKAVAKAGLLKGRHLLEHARRQPHQSHVSSPPPRPHDNLHGAVEAAFKEQQAGHHAGASGAGDKSGRSKKLVVFTFKPTLANATAAVQGTVSMTPEGLTRSMEEDFKGSEFEEDYNYVVYKKACDAPRSKKYDTRKAMIRDKDHKGWTLEDFFARIPRLEKAKLTMAELAMLRLYSSIGHKFNPQMRKRQGVQKWATSISLLTSAIIKLSTQSDMQPMYRCIPSARVDPSPPDGPVTCGFVHLDNAFSSATRNVDVVLK
jgi:hypothetical protein